ncbi:hypothetical protein Hdeb2414_s0013g00404881 [Helianthus debilis subsp. tardiflorus]
MLESRASTSTSQFKFPRVQMHELLFLCTFTFFRARLGRDYFTYMALGYLLAHHSR